MAVTYFTSPMGWNRGVNDKRKGAAAKQHMANTQKPVQPAKNEPRVIARINCSTKEAKKGLPKLRATVLSTALETASTAGKCNGSEMQKGIITGIKRATSLSEATQSPTTSRKKGSRILGFGKKDKVEDEKQGGVKEKPIRPFVMGEREAYASANTDPLYPVTENGWLRDAYVKMLVERVNEENNRALGWDARCIRKWFGQHLQTQIRHGKVPRNKQAHFLAAVELHRRMSTDPRVPRPNGVSEHVDDLWREVADALDPAMKYSKAVIMHNAGTSECTLEDFIQDFHRVVVRNDWNTEITTAMFPARTTVQ